MENKKNRDYSSFSKRGDEGDMTIQYVRKMEAKWRKEVEKTLSRVKDKPEFCDVLKERGCEPIDDGCMDAGTWCKSGGERILWLLKEHNEEPKQYGNTAASFGVEEDRLRIFWDLHTNPEGFAKNVNRFRSLKMIERASWGILKKNVSVDAGADASATAVDTFKHLAILEVGKTAGRSRTTDHDLGQLCKMWGKIVLGQIKDYKPDVVIVAGKQFERLYDYDKVKDEQCKGHFPQNNNIVDLWEIDGMRIIHADHPSYFRVSREDYVRGIVEAALAPIR